MAETIADPLSLIPRSRSSARSSAAVSAAAEGDRALPQTRRITPADLGAALRAGLADFGALRTDVLFVAFLHPVLGMLLIGLAYQAGLWVLIFPLAAGFALLGPLAAVGTYELSRRREAGERAGWSDGFAFVTTSAMVPVLVAGLYLAGLFMTWLIAAYLIWQMTLGPLQHATLMAFLTDVVLTPRGWIMFGVGSLVGLGFAAFVLSISLVTLPLLIHRRVSLPVAVATSFEITRQNPGTVALWGLVIAVLLVLGSLPALIGLVLVLPLLGHATWHLYRRAVV